ncbi:MAG: sigma factor [Planctomycetota bacterium]
MAVPARFTSTRWSQVVAAGSGNDAARSAMAWLCERYWEPLRAHVRRRGFRDSDADDLTQEFLLAVVRGGVVERADRDRGRFRTFLLACLEHHLGHARERAAAAKRGGGVAHESLDLQTTEVDPTRGFDRDWAMALLARAKDRLAQSIADGEPTRRFHVLARFLSTNGDADTYTVAGNELGVDAGAVRVAVHRLRGDFATCLRAEIAETLAKPDQDAVDAELRDLLAVLGEQTR